MHADVIVVGGSYAGLSAALPLARARRSVLIVDAGERRNRFAAYSHGFLTQDGMPPGQIAAEARQQVMQYPTVTWCEGRVATIEGSADDFGVRLQGGEVHQARRLILATGVADELPGIPGLAERWGMHVFHCPYCHGYELHQGRVGVLATSPAALHQGLMLPDWGQTTLFLNDALALEESQREQLTARGASIVSGAVSRVEGEAVTLVMTDGRRFELDGLFVSTRTQLSPLASQLGCAMEESPLGLIIGTSETQATSVAGVFACGDTARLSHSVALAVGDGAMAGMAAHRSLMFGLG